MAYHIHVTINTERGEYEHTIPTENSIDEAMKRIISMYPKATSVVLAIVPFDTEQRYLGEGA